MNNYEQARRLCGQLKQRKKRVLGVYYDDVRSKYLAQIGVSGKQRVLGRFNSLEEASNAYLAAKRELHEGNQL